MLTFARFRDALDSIDLRRGVWVYVRQAMLAGDWLEYAPNIAAISPARQAIQPTLNMHG
jgi:hypothetical protein